MAIKVMWLGAVLIGLRIVTAAALGVDAYIHADLATRYDGNRQGGISQGDLFRIEAAVASLVALLVLLYARLFVWAIAAVVAASALGAVLLYYFVDVGTLGPLPDMYEPAWYTEKTVSAIAVGIATVTAVGGFACETVRRAKSRRASGVHQGPSEGGATRTSRRLRIAAHRS